MNGGESYFTFTTLFHYAYLISVCYMYNSLKCSSLGMCKKCGDVGMIACSRCKGMGLIKSNGLFGFSIMDELYPPLDGAESQMKSIGCSKCKGRGHFCCPGCSNKPQV